MCKKINHDLLLESIGPKVSLMQSMKSDYKNMVEGISLIAGGKEMMVVLNAE